MYRNRKINVFSHLLAWLVLFSMPYVLSYGQEQNIYRIIIHFWIPMVFYAILFYLNYFVLIDQFLFKKRIFVFVAINLVLIALFLTLKEQLESKVFIHLIRQQPEEKIMGPPFKLFIYIQMLSYIAPLVFSIALKSTKRWIETEAARKEADNYRLQSELQHLRYQLQPHFFFNSLNNIYSMVDIAPNEAKKAIHSLSKLMRYMLYDTNEELVPLSKEIDFMLKYIDLMKLRVSDKTEVSYSFPTDETGIKIAPLLFISLIENAFKHGVSASEKSHIDISLSCEKNKVIFNIENDNFPKTTSDKSGSGIGWKNLENRLRLLYPGKYHLTNKVVNNRFIVNLEIETE